MQVCRVETELHLGIPSVNQPFGTSRWRPISAMWSRIWRKLSGEVSVIEVMVVKNNRFTPTPERVACLSAITPLPCLSTGCQEGTDRVQEGQWHVVLSSARRLQEHLQWLSTTLLPNWSHCQPACHPAIYSGWQQDIQWLLEPSSFPSEKLQHPLPGPQQSKRSEYGQMEAILALIPILKWKHVFKKVDMLRPMDQSIQISLLLLWPEDLLHYTVCAVHFHSVWLLWYYRTLE